MSKLDFTKVRDEVTIDGMRVIWTKNSEYRETMKKARVFVWADDETLLESLENRTRRPYNVWRVIASKVVVQLGFPDVKLAWSQRAGCSCPCSPGFIMEDGLQIGLRGGDLHIHVTGAPTFDETKLVREVVYDD